jgi:hypothetical protein
MATRVSLKCNHDDLGGQFRQLADALHAEPPSTIVDPVTHFWPSSKRHRRYRSRSMMFRSFVAASTSAGTRAPEKSGRPPRVVAIQMGADDVRHLIGAEAQLPREDGPEPRVHRAAIQVMDVHSGCPFHGASRRDGGAPDRPSAITRLTSPTPLSASGSDASGENRTATGGEPSRTCAAKRGDRDKRAESSLGERRLARRRTKHRSDMGATFQSTAWAFVGHCDVCFSGGRWRITAQASHEALLGLRCRLRRLGPLGCPSSTGTASLASDGSKAADGGSDVRTSRDLEARQS